MLTTEQTQLFKAAVLAETAPAIVAARTPATRDDRVIVAFYNAPRSPDWWVWQSRLDLATSRGAIVAGAIQLDNLTVGKRDALLYLVSGDLDCRQASVRDAIDNLCGTQNVLKAAMVAVETRKATRLEALLSVGTGSLASPATTTFEGAVTLDEVSAMMNA